MRLVACLLPKYVLNTMKLVDYSHDVTEGVAGVWKISLNAVNFCIWAEY